MAPQIRPNFSGGGHWPMDQEFLALEFAHKNRRSRTPADDALVFSNTAWLVAADTERDRSIARGLAERRPEPYRHFLLSSRDGRRRLSEGDLVIFASNELKREVRAFVYGCRLSEKDKSVLASDLEANAADHLGACLVGAGPIETMLLAFSPAGRREQRTHSGRNTLEQVFDSLQCKSIIDSPYLKERLSEGVLRSCPRPVDPLVTAVFSRFCADAMSAEPIERWTTGKGQQISSMYKQAEKGFEALDLRRHAAECARRARRVSEKACKQAQGVLLELRPPKVEPEDRPKKFEALGGLGFAARQCVALRLTSSRTRRLSPIHRQSGVFQDLGNIRVPDVVLLSAMRDMSDHAFIPVATPVRRADRTSAGAFDLNIEMTPRLLAMLGLRRSAGECSAFEDMQLVVKSETCHQDDFPAPVNRSGRARVPMIARRAGRHRVEIRVMDRNSTEAHSITFDLEP